MTSALTYETLANYRAFLERVDTLCAEIVAEFSEEIACRAGCSGCCRHLTLFPVEAANLAEAVAQLSPEIQDILAGRIDWPEDSPCPLLLDDCCLVYSARPVICRTHGFPLLTDVKGEKKVDFCEENFRGVTSLPGNRVIDLEALNRALIAINGKFEADLPGADFSKKRYSLAGIIRLALRSQKDTR